MRRNEEQEQATPDLNNINMSEELYLEIKTDEPLDESITNPTPAKKGRGRPKKHMESIEWSDAATETLIELWQTKEELFCRNHPYFYAKDYKDKAIEAIRSQMEARGYHTTTNQILGKIQSLRTYFCSQRAKFQQMKKVGHLTEDDSECRWRFYKSLQFLDENMKPRENIKRERLSNSDAGYMNNSFLPPSMNYPSSVTYEMKQYNDGVMHHNNISPPPALQNLNEESQKVLKNDLVSNSNKNYEDKLFGELVSNMISQLPPGQHKDLLKLEIQQLIIKSKYEIAPKQES